MIKKWHRFFYPILKFIKKELIQTLSDKRMRPLIFGAPIVQLLIFGFSVNMDIKDLSLGVFNQDRSAISRELVRQITQNEHFTLTHEILHNDEIDQLFYKNKAEVILIIPPYFEKELIKNGKTDFQILINGVNSNSASMAKGYIEAIVQNYNQKLLNNSLKRAGYDLFFKNLPQIAPEIRMIYNQELETSNFMVPGIMAMILFILTILLTVLSITREREMGTFELLIVSPIKPSQLVLGKTLPYAVIGLLDVTLVLIAGKIFFDVPIRSSIFMVYVASLAFIFISLGLGLFISSLSKTQSQSILTMIFILQPSIILSGLMFPIENMPSILQYISYFNPLTYYIEMLRYLFLKGVILWSNFFIMIGFSLIIYTLSGYQFHKNLD